MSGVEDGAGAPEDGDRGCGIGRSFGQSGRLDNLGTPEIVVVCEIKVHGGSVAKLELGMGRHSWVL